jgi:Family of unknown function (DUF5522)
MKQELVEKEDYYFDDNGYMVFTGKYLLTRETCCGNGCRHCPYGYINVPEQTRTKLLTFQKLIPAQAGISKKKI